jgi:RHS repeat-associated protein
VHARRRWQQGVCRVGWVREPQGAGTWRVLHWLRGRPPRNCCWVARVTWTYTYDGLGRRVSKQRLDGKGAVVERTRFVWDGPVLIEQTKSTGGPVAESLTTTWEHLGWTPISQHEHTGHQEQAGRQEDTGRDEESGADGLVVVGSGAAEGWSQERVDAAFYAIVTDLVGTPTELLTPVGESAWRQRKTLWGLPAEAARAGGGSARASTPLRFPGQYADEETGLYYNLFRHYDPGTGRYVTTDPLGLAPAPNPHTYPDNPLTTIDPLGLTPCQVVPGGTENLRDGRHMMTGDALRTATDFLGPGYRDMGDGRFLSADGLRQVRLTDRDLANPSQNPHMNFETYRDPIGPGLRGGRPKSNIHIFLPEEPGWLP